jgi:hypothetical protein
MSPARRAKSRLTDFEIKETSLVDRAANLRRFAVIKRNTMTTSAQKNELKLPKAVKDAMMDAAGQALDHFTSLAEVVSSAAEDDAAAVPPDLLAAFDAGSKMLAGVAAQFAGSEAPPGDAPPEGDAPPPAEGGPPAGEEEEEQKGAPSTDPAGAAKGDAAATAKGLPAPEKDTMKLATTLREGDSLTQVLRKATALAQLELGEVEKAGRKMAGARYQKLVDLHEGLGKLLNELAFDEASGAGKDGKGSAKKSLSEGTEGEGVAPPEATDLKALIAKANTTIQNLQARLAEAREEQVAKGVPAAGAGASNAGAIEGAGAPPAVVWEPDMSAAVAKKKAARR